MSRRPDGTEPTTYEVGDYGRYEGRWYVLVPGGHLADVTKHQVIEEADGTITVSPSIAVWTGRGGKPVEAWHGYLTAGVLKSV